MYIAKMFDFKHIVSGVNAESHDFLLPIFGNCTWIKDDQERYITFNLYGMSNSLEIYRLQKLEILYRVEILLSHLIYEIIVECYFFLSLYLEIKLEIFHPFSNGNQYNNKRQIFKKTIFNSLFLPVVTSVEY